MTDITTALETVREAVEWSYQRRVRATLPALSTIEAELTRLREERDDFERIAELREKEVMKLRERYDIKRDANRF